MLTSHSSALSVSFDYKGSFFIFIPVPQPLQKWKELSLTLVVVLELVKTPCILPLKSSSSLWGRKRSQNSSLSILWYFQIIPGILNSSNKLIRLSLVWENYTTTGEHWLHWNFSFPTLASVLWPKNSFSTLFCTSFCSGSSAWCSLCPAGLTSLVTSHCLLIPAQPPHPSHTGKPGWEF